MDYAINVLTCLAMGIGDPPFPISTTTTVSPDPLNIVSRRDWLAQPAEGALEKLEQPIPWVIITHTTTESCHTRSECVLRVRLIQSFHIESRGWVDIGYNFLIGGDGSVYIGRGWDYHGAHTPGYSKKSIGIAFIGTYRKDSPTREQVEACKKLIKQGVDQLKLSKDYKLVGQRQLMATMSPGDKLFDIIKEWPHFASNFTIFSNNIMSRKRN
ncbi:peptidoglycan recognition protein-like [Maniola jurtina]|uniref:peptidoglycan recognition protein-like n=1 Tax=Maniola jurtina TaxID=191418 RepID=UPI001E68A1C7|nr:peptidoglycan recognition protein-like [Maniola jurtina]